MDELELEQLEKDINIKNKVEDRIKDLSSKVKMTSEERDEYKRLNESLSSEKESISKERDFYKDFSGVSAKYTGAHEYQDKILEKVRSGYSVEDAAISVLAKEGKFQGIPTPAQEREIAAGGSAPTGLAGAGTKSIDEMSKAEKRAALLEAEASGEFKF